MRTEHHCPPQSILQSFLSQENKIGEDTHMPAYIQMPCRDRQERLGEIMVKATMAGTGMLVGIERKAVLLKCLPFQAVAGITRVRWQAYITERRKPPPR